MRITRLTFTWAFCSAVQHVTAQVTCPTVEQSFSVDWSGLIPHNPDATAQTWITAGLQVVGFLPGVGSYIKGIGTAAVGIWKSESTTGGGIDPNKVKQTINELYTDLTVLTQGVSTITDLQLINDDFELMGEAIQTFNATCYPDPSVADTSDLIEQLNKLITASNAIYNRWSAFGSTPATAQSAANAVLAYLPVAASLDLMALRNYVEYYDYACPAGSGCGMDTPKNIAEQYITDRYNTYMGFFESWFKLWQEWRLPLVKVECSDGTQGTCPYGVTATVRDFLTNQACIFSDGGAMSVMGRGTHRAMTNDILHAMALNLDPMSRLHYLIPGNTDMEPKYNTQYQQGFLLGPYTVYDGQVVGYDFGTSIDPSRPYLDPNANNCTQAPIDMERTTSLQIYVINDDYYSDDIDPYGDNSIMGLWNNADIAAGRECGYGSEWTENKPITVDIPFSVEQSVSAVNFYSANWYDPKYDGPPPDMFFERFSLVYNNSGTLTESGAFPDAYDYNEECKDKLSDCYGSILRISSGEAWGLYSFGVGVWSEPQLYAPWSHASDGNMGYVMARFKPVSVQGVGLEGPPPLLLDDDSGATKHGLLFFVGLLFLFVAI